MASDSDVVVGNCKAQPDCLIETDSSAVVPDPLSHANATTSSKRRTWKKKTFSPNSHYQKPHTVFERYRRSRVSRAVAEIASCLPACRVKPDKATVLEAAVDFLEYFHHNVSNVEQFDTEFAYHLGSRAAVAAGTLKSSAVTEMAPGSPCGAEPAIATTKIEKPVDLSPMSAKPKNEVSLKSKRSKRAKKLPDNAQGQDQNAPQEAAGNTNTPLQITAHPSATMSKSKAAPFIFMEAEGADNITNTDLSESLPLQNTIFLSALNDIMT